ncbi:MAG TPA: dual specificity protein phosphatase family protein [Dongiaceae bacterium]|nr:dual specificity protein phosphatase family protein [Dongiaceae bacterium]
MTLVYWINEDKFRLGIAPRPRGNDWLDQEIGLLHKEGVAILVSALTVDEQVELGLENEANACRATGIDFVSFPIEDRSVPFSQKNFAVLIQRLTDLLASGKAVAIHCRTGIGRSSMISAALLMKQGYSADAAFRTIQVSRGCAVPDTLEQRKWIENCSFLRKTRELKR